MSTEIKYVLKGQPGEPLTKIGSIKGCDVDPHCLPVVGSRLIIGKYDTKVEQLEYHISSRKGFLWTDAHVSIIVWLIEY